MHWNNSGAAFGSFQNGNAVFTILAILVILAILFYYPKVDPRDWTLRLAMGLQLGGASGNLIDRLQMGRVTDFISIGTFPVFNVADSAISVGVVVLLLGVWLRERDIQIRGRWPRPSSLRFPTPMLHFELPISASPEQRLDHFLVRALPQYSRSRLQSLIEQGCVQIDGSAAKKSGQLVPPGSIVVVDVPAPMPATLYG